MQQAAILIDDGALMTTSLAARALGLAEGTIRAAAERGELACIRLATGQRLFRREDVERLRTMRGARL